MHAHPRQLITWEPWLNLHVCFALQKLVLEVMMLENLTTRGVFELMHATLAASEIRCADCATDDEELARHDSQPKGNHNRMQPLYNCGLAALRGLNQEAFVSDFKTSAGALAFSLHA